VPDTDRVFKQQVAEVELSNAKVDIARLEERVGNLTRVVDDLRTSVAHMSTAIDAMQKTMSEARGGWRTLVLLGGMLTAFGAFLGWLAERITWRGLP
jgi:hypothetical protein